MRGRPHRLTVHLYVQPVASHSTFLLRQPAPASTHTGMRGRRHNTHRYHSARPRNPPNSPPYYSPPQPASGLRSPAHGPPARALHHPLRTQFQAGAGSTSTAGGAGAAPRSGEIPPAAAPRIHAHKHAGTPSPQTKLAKRVKLMGQQRPIRKTGTAVHRHTPPHEQAARAGSEQAEGVPLWIFPKRFSFFWCGNATPAGMRGRPPHPRGPGCGGRPRGGGGQGRGRKNRPIIPRIHAPNVFGEPMRGMMGRVFERKCSASLDALPSSCWASTPPQVYLGSRDSLHRLDAGRPFALLGHSKVEVARHP